MPQVDPSGNGPGLPVSRSSPGAWVPGPIYIPDTMPVVLGDLVMPFGPRSITFSRKPNVVQQITRDAIILWDYGFLPTTYTIEGYANGASLDDLQNIISQFGGGPLTAIRFLAPSVGIADMVRYVSWDVLQDESNSHLDPHYAISLSAAGRQRSRLVSGRVPVGT